MSEPEPIEWFNGRKLCPRCCKDGQLCCEMSRESCDACDGSGFVDDWDDEIDEVSRQVCHVCDGAGRWWHCDCDEHGVHQQKEIHRSNT